MITTRLVSLAALVALAGCRGSNDAATSPSEPPPSATAGAVTAERLVAADEEPGQWMSHGRTYGEQRFSPLTEIDTTNVGELGLAWYGDLKVGRAQESTPLFVDGVLYVTTAWSNVKAFDARSGSELWSYNAEVPGQ